MWRASRKEEAISVHAADGLLLVHYEEGYDRICEKLPQLPSASQFDPHPPTKLAQHGHPMTLHTLGLDLVGPVNPPSYGYIWILVATEYFTKWAETIPLSKATRGVVVNFIKENIIVRFGVPYRIVSDNGTPFVNREVRKMLEFYQNKHHRSLPYYPKGTGRQKQ